MSDDRTVDLAADSAVEPVIGLVCGIENTQKQNILKTDYQSCRQDFLRAGFAVQGLPLAQKSWRLAESELFTDVFYLGNPEAERCVVLISGTHGVEGFCGSAIQCHLLQDIGCYQSLLRDCALVMVHALNPWGMQWARRCDQDGIDLNRNFIDFAHLPQPDERYAEVLHALHLPQAQREAAMLQMCCEWGQVAFDRVCSGGQYTYDWAPFYGGKQASWSRQVIDQIISEWNLAQRELVVIDIHCGLGTWAFGELISDHQAQSAAAAYAQQIFSNASMTVAQTDIGGSSSVTKHGLLDYHWHQFMQERGCFLTLEFGTYSTQNLFEVINADHLFWRSIWEKFDAVDNCLDHDLQNNGAYIQQRAAMLRHFFPTDQLWQQAILLRGREVVERALQSLSPSMSIDPPAFRPIIETR